MRGGNEKGSNTPRLREESHPQSLVAGRRQGALHPQVGGSLFACCLSGSAGSPEHHSVPSSSDLLARPPSSGIGHAGCGRGFPEWSPPCLASFSIMMAAVGKSGAAPNQHQLARQEAFTSSECSVAGVMVLQPMQAEQAGRWSQGSTHKLPLHSLAAFLSSGCVLGCS